MYESPIEMYVRDVTTELCRSLNDQYFVRLSKAVDFDIDREELIKALSYDRFQYERGYRDGLAEHRWIPVSERLPEPFSFVNCTCHSLIDDREDWVVETCYLPQPPNSPYSDWGNIPMLNWRECEVIAWMYRDIPEPYKAESEGKG